MICPLCQSEMMEITTHGDAGRRWQCSGCGATMSAFLLIVVDDDLDLILPPSIQSFLESL